MKMPHALLIPLPAQGHINPMMQLASNLLSHGSLVTFVNTDYNHQRIVQANGDQNSVLHNISCDMLRMISVPDGLPLEDTRKDVPKMFRAIENSMGPSVIHKMIQDINDKEEEEHKLTCIIADGWMCCGLNEVANRHHISMSVFHASLASSFALHHFSATPDSLAILNSDGTPKEDKIIKFLPILPPLYPGELPWMCEGEYLFRKGVRMVQEIKHIKWLLFNSLYELEAPVVDDLSIKGVGAYPIGPLIPCEFLDGGRSRTTKALRPSFWAEEVECLEWLDKQSAKSVIYLSFGSIAVWSEKQVEEFALGVEDTQRPFLWVLRSGLMDGHDKAVLPEGFLERITERGCIVSWAPQLMVLSHPSIACFVTHCGWNSVQESIIMGVPMLCSPSFADQFLIRTYIVDVWKVGLPFKANENGIIEKEVFKKTVEKLMVEEEGVEIRKEVMKWKTIGRNGMKEEGSSSNNFNLFLNAMTQQLN